MKIRSRVLVFILSFLTWIALTGILDIQQVVVGFFVAVIIALAAGHLLITTRKKNPLIKRVLYGLFYLLIFTWEMIKANLHVAYIVLHPFLPINPGIVKIRTSLKKDTSLTILCNSITLTPGTLTVDIDPGGNYLYIHLIDVKSKDIDANTKRIGARFEPILTEVFE
jgi:multicomponent Na+:H+ antiporter subunit E